MTMKPAVKLGDYAVSERTAVLFLMLAVFMFFCLFILGCFILAGVDDIEDKLDAPTGLEADR